MAVLALEMPVYAAGRTFITLNVVCKRSGSNNDNCKFRIVRRMSGQTDTVLAGTPDFVLPADKDSRGWTWVDTNLPASGTATYALQIYRIDGGGTFYEMILSGVHYKR